MESSRVRDPRAHLGAIAIVAFSAIALAAAATLETADSRLPPLPTALAGCEALSPRTERVDLATDGTQARRRILRASISATGRFAAFSSASPTLVRGDRNGRADVFVRDLWTSSTTRVSVSSAGVEGDGASF